MAERTERSVVREYLEALIIAAIFLWFTNTFVIQTFYIPSGSMENTLLIGDHLFVNRFIYGPTASEIERKLLPLREVRRGDIIVFRSKEGNGLDVVKRVVGTGGDEIRIADKQLWVDGKLVDDSKFAIHKSAEIYPAFPGLPDQFRLRDNFGPVTVPEKRLFCMGDNRDESYDSRFWGPLPLHLVKGRALFIYWSNGAEISDEQQPVGTKLVNLVRTAFGFVTHTRWGRTFRLIR
jgi:signal peptidase I